MTNSEMTKSIKIIDFDTLLHKALLLIRNLSNFRGSMPPNTAIMERNITIIGELSDILHNLLEARNNTFTYQLIIKNLAIFLDQHSEYFSYFEESIRYQE